MPWCFIKLTPVVGVGGGVMDEVIRYAGTVMALRRVILVVYGHGSDS